MDFKDKAEAILDEYYKYRSMTHPPVASPIQNALDQLNQAHLEGIKEARIEELQYMNDKTTQVYGREVYRNELRAEQRRKAGLSKEDIDND